jgi:hypothetical protein
MRIDEVQVGETYRVEVPHHLPVSWYSGAALGAPGVVVDVGRAAGVPVPADDH